ncbi:probable rhomboid family protease [Natronomonas pharaonis DSM 2160]|uniref:Probable rhomboid family protease n=1 Tax=Natronomonas pharaonis (strain ATCC 35678 / DSM 2160 / CIP 103997 / JCM 8858 / NBRC 14720 / NCIMB 2260 / Gabara) TaxID=348780 RepID=A0A1U7EVW6_NATPD|nr:rhomboid family intramembrane serine protease [Natronomonas pharaonis]CAI49206.1 probable rhomboid family protease [Natronomonas pharaonis DSM 2160]
MPLPAAVWYPVLAAALAVSLAAVYYLSQPAGRWGQLVRKRLLLGLPWGTLLAVGGVLAFYLLAQDGLANPNAPVQIPFRAYGYTYPLGVLTAGFAHASLGHLVGNLIGTLVFGSLAEYAWSHFPTERGSTSFSSLRMNPFARIAAFAAAVFAFGIVSAAFGLGPVIGFSGVVFAFVGFALVRFPLATAVATLTTGVVSQLYNAVRSPESVHVASETFSQPWWAGISLQGHLLGLLAGAVFGAALLYRRGVRPNPTHIWLAALVFAVDRGLWAVYLPEGPETFRLFRALGLAAVFCIAALVAGAAVATPRDLLSRIDLSRREAAYGLLIAALLAVALVAVPLNLYTIDDPDAGLDADSGIEVEDYTVYYAEDVENQFVPAIPVPGDGNVTADRIEASGIIIVSAERDIWWQEVSKSRLASNGEATLRLGSLTWNEDVHVTRPTWRVAGTESSYLVEAQAETADERSVLFQSPPAQADARLDGRNVSVAPADSGFELRVTRDNETLGTAAVPADGESVTAGGVQFERDDRSLFAERGDTRLRIAQRADRS